MTSLETDDAFRPRLSDGGGLVILPWAKKVTSSNSRGKADELLPNRFTGAEPGNSCSDEELSRCFFSVTASGAEVGVEEIHHLVFRHVLLRYDPVCSNARTLNIKRSNLIELEKFFSVDSCSALI